MGGVIAAIVMALIAVLVHFEALIVVERVVHRVQSFRLSLLLAWLGLLTAHVIEIWLYAGAYWVCEHLGIGTLAGMVDSYDYVYFSAVVYTTIGFGDIIPSEGLHMLAGSQGLIGLSLIAWSATITYGHTQVLLERRAERKNHNNNKS